MGRWIQTPRGAKWDPSGDYAPSELVAANARCKEMSDLCKPPGAETWKAESTIQAAGRPMSKAEFESFKKERGLVEVSKGETSERVIRKTVKDVAREALAQAREDLKRTGQYVQPGTPTTAETKDKMAKGLPVVRKSLDDLPEVRSQEKPKPQVEAPRPRGIPWGYVGGKETIAMRGVAKAIGRLEWYKGEETTVHGVEKLENIDNTD